MKIGVEGVPRAKKGVEFDGPICERLGAAVLAL
jgi:hypothetical protein